MKGRKDEDLHRRPGGDAEQEMKMNRRSPAQVSNLSLTCRCTISSVPPVKTSIPPRNLTVLPPATSLLRIHSFPFDSYDPEAILHDLEPQILFNARTQQPLPQSQRNGAPPSGEVGLSSVPMKMLSSDTTLKERGD
ncbi:hypothetical protein LINGRAHAP2_LOCUS26828 [Linum grandiflorum]